MDRFIFSKYQGSGNDFILVDNRSHSFSDINTSLIARLCDRKFGVGSDGIILIQDHPKLDFEMVFFNPDGSQSFCGNGSRCAAAYANELGIIKNKTNFLAIDGAHEAFIDEQSVRVKMSDCLQPTEMGGGQFIDTGSPHFVKYVSDIKDYPVLKEGTELRNNTELFGEAGTNVNFVEELRKGLIFVRTFERGVENETLSCGTGVTAAAIVYGLDKSLNQVDIETLGGELRVNFQSSEKNQVTHLYLSGPAEKVFTGEFMITNDLI